MNVTTHVIGAMAFCALPVAFFTQHFSSTLNAHAVDLFVVTLYCGTVALCFTFSAL